LYHRYEDGEPVEFEVHDVRGESFSRCHGELLTTEVRTSARFDSQTEAEAAAATREQQLFANGGSCSAKTHGTVMDVELRPLLKSAATKAFQATRKAFQDHVIDGYALYSDDDAMTLVHICTSEASRRDPDDYWVREEWTLEAGERHLELPHRLLLERCDAASALDDDTLVWHRDSAFEDCVAVLEELRREGEFSKDLPDERVVVVFSVSDSEAGDFSFERLNPPSTVAAFQEWLRKWE